MTIPDTYLWLDQNGVEWDVRDMADRHLSNAIHFLERKRRASRADRNLIEESFDGELNLDTITTDLNSLEGAIDHSLLILRLEWSRRHLASKQ